MTEVQHKATILTRSVDDQGRITNQRVVINTPPFATEAQLEIWLAEFLRQNPDSQVVGKSW
jgi:hypothetical protein